MTAGLYLFQTGIPGRSLPVAHWLVRTRLLASGSATGARLSCAFLVQRVVYTMERKPEAIGNAQLVIDLAQIVLDHLLGCTELISDLLVALALRDAGDDRQLFG
jgi:hypothetical protein